MRTYVLSLATAVACGLLACSSSSDSGDAPTADSGVDASGADTTSTDAAVDVVNDATETAIDDGLDTTPPYPGKVYLWTVPKFSTAYVFPVGVWNLPCLAGAVGECSVCTNGSSPSPTGNPGYVVVTGPKGERTLSPSAGNTYAEEGSTDPIYGPGDSVKFSSTGAGIPKFADLTLKVPTKFTLDAPSCPGGCTDTTPLSVVRTKDLEVAWKDTDANLVAISLSSTDDAPPRPLLYCNFDGSKGKGTVPAALLQKLGAGAGTFSVSAYTRGEGMAGDWPVVVELHDAEGISLGGGGNVVFE